MEIACLEIAYLERDYLLRERLLIWRLLTWKEIDYLENDYVVLRKSYQGLCSRDTYPQESPRAEARSGDWC